MDFYRYFFADDREYRPISFYFVYLVAIIFSFQVVLTAYIGTSYLSNFIADSTVGLVFAVGSLGAIALTFFMTDLLNRFGNVNTIIAFTVLTSLSLVFIGLGFDTTSTILAFILFLAVSPQIYFNLDIFMEALIDDNESSTGSKRGIILTIMSFASFLSPFAAGYLVGTDNNFPAVYFVSALIGLLIIAIVIAKLRFFNDPKYIPTTINGLLHTSLKNPNIKLVIAAQFLLQLFYAWVVMYVPLYMANEIGMSWDVIGNIIAVGLFAFVIIEYPAGWLADNKIGETEMMATGFFILAASTALISTFDADHILPWMMLTFATRIGASLVEVTAESYFFKQVKANDSNLISFFRLARPVANLFGALLGVICLLYLPFQYIFIVLGIILFSGVFIASHLVDTK